MNTGKSLKILQAQRDIKNKVIAYDMGMSIECVSIHRNNKTMNGHTLKAFAKYFEITCWEFIKVGEEQHESQVS